jgi:chemotaxis protein methyltransferase CheR
VIELTSDKFRGDVLSGTKLSDETFVLLRDFIYMRTGIFFTEKKKYLLEGRIAKRLQMLKVANFEDYVHLLKYGQQKHFEFEHLCNIITINETSFFRNEPQLTAFYQRLAKEVIDSKKALGNSTVRIWSAACSSGEEPYTLALIYLEYLKPKYPDLRFEIVGSDINTAMLDYAYKGVYGHYAVRSMPEVFVKKYFDNHEGLYQLHDDVRELVRFEYINLIDHQKMRQMTHFDFVFCANVLIYFDQKSKIQVVGDLYDSLNRGGYFYIGSSEMLHGVSTAFKLVSIPKATVYKKE